MTIMQRWKSYEDVARFVLRELRHYLRLDHVDGYSDLIGRSGTTWRVEATSRRTSDGGVLIVECRRYTTAGVSQEDVGGIAYRIIDTSTSGGIIVSPLPLQRGAALVAGSNDILHLKLHAESTPEAFLAEFMGNQFLRVHMGDQSAFGMPTVGATTPSKYKEGET